MASLSVDAPSRTRLSSRQRQYWLATGLFCAMFVVSALLTFVDPDGTREVMRRLGYPEFLIYPQTAAKVAGVVVILLGRWRALTGLALAGFLYDLLLALAGHINADDPQGWLAVAGLALWAGAFFVDHQGYRYARAG